MSAEPSRKKSYSTDLRWRIVYQRIAMNLPFYKIARNLNIAASTANRIYHLFEQTGGVDPVQRLERHEIRAVDMHTELHVIDFVIENPSVYLNEVCYNIRDITGEAVSPSTVCRLLKRYGISWKKIRQVSLQRCDSLRGAFMAQTFLYKREMFVWTCVLLSPHSTYLCMKFYFTNTSFIKQNHSSYICRNSVVTGP